MLKDSTNLGLTRMSETGHDTSLRQFAHVHDGHVSEAACTEALAHLINAHRVLTPACIWATASDRAPTGSISSFAAVRTEFVQAVRLSEAEGSTQPGLKHRGYAGRRRSAPSRLRPRKSNNC